MKLLQCYIDNIITTALMEDINYIDAATDLLIEEEQQGSARFFAKADGILCGIDIALRVFELIQPDFKAEVYKRDGDELKKGDVITFMADEETVVTHRIDEVIHENADGETITKFRTKGDANDVADAKLVHYKNVLGVPAFSIPLLGYLAFYIQRPPGLYIALIVGTLLVASVFLPGNKGKEKTASKEK
jgi:hypothetical protein